MTYPIRKSFFVSALVCSSACLSLSPSALAQTESYLAASELGNSNVPTDFVVPSFNTDLGVLESVNLTLKFDICPNVSIYNSTDAPIAFTNASISVPVEVTWPGSLTFDTTLKAQVKTGTANPGVTTYPLASTWTYTLEKIAPSALSLWEDQPGDKVTLVATPSFPTFGGTSQGNGLFFGGSAIEWGNITVNYTYAATSATPEPRGAYLSAIVALAMVIGVLRRRQAPAHI